MALAGLSFHRLFTSLRSREKAVRTCAKTLLLDARFPASDFVQGQREAGFHSHNNGNGAYLLESLGRIMSTVSLCGSQTAVNLSKCC
jgi:hypothetical protein